MLSGSPISACGMVSLRPPPLASAALVALLLSLAGSTNAASHRQHSRVLLSDIQVLTLYRHEYTTGRRNAPIRQLECRRGCSQASGTYPEEMQCYNKGWDGQDVNWKCEATLPKGTHLSKVEVQCEGFDYPEDPYILAGSCGVSFEVVGDAPRRAAATPSGALEEPQPWSLWSYFKLAVFILLIWKCFPRCCGRAAGHVDPAPPSGGSNFPDYSSAYTRPPVAPTYASAYASSAGSGPGFFSGLGVGAALGSAYERLRAPPTAPAPPSSGGGSSGRVDDSDSTETSTAYAKTKRR